MKVICVKMERSVSLRIKLNSSLRYLQLIWLRSTGIPEQWLYLLDFNWRSAHAK
jgi:hypothetical protein